MKERFIFSLTAMVVLQLAICSVNAMESGSRGIQEGVKQGIQSVSSEKINTDNLRELLTFKNELSLSFEQIESIRKIREQSIKDMQSRYGVLNSRQLELSVLLAAPKPDFAGAHTMEIEVSKAAASLQAVPIEAYENAYNLLTENQKIKFAIIREKLKKERDLEKRNSN